MDTMPFSTEVMVTVGLVLVGGLIWLASVFERRRRETLRSATGALGLSIDFARDRSLHHQFAAFSETETGDDRYSTDVVTGNFDGEDVIAFSYHYATTTSDANGGSSKTSHHFRIAAVALPAPLPTLTIRPEGVFSKLAQAVGYDDIDFESAEFSRAYCVRSADRQFAYDVCHARMMEDLLDGPRRNLATIGGWIALLEDDRLAPEEIKRLLQTIIAIRRLLPDYLFERTP